MTYINSFNLNGESEVMNEFIKIASEQKIIDLYDTKNDRDESGEDLINEAHPEPVEVAESYRENGGVVENENEQQEEDIDASTRMPNGQTSQKSTNAAGELIDQLIIVADHMDCLGESDIAIFADNISHKIDKEAAWYIPALAIGIPLIIGAWFLTSYSNKSDIKNTGVEANIQEVDNRITNYSKAILEQVSGEHMAQSVERLQDLKNTIDSVKKTRDSYMSSIATLSENLRALTGLSNKEMPNAETVKNAMKSPEAQDIVKKIHKNNDKYSDYIKTIILPSLRKDLNYFKTYFAATKGIEPQSQGIWHSFESLFHTHQDLPSEGDAIVTALTKTIATLEADVELRKLDANESIDNISSRIKTDLSKEFDIPKAQEDDIIKL
jgi:hypothetical protein